MFSRDIDIIVYSHYEKFLAEKLIDYAARPKEYVNIVQESNCPFSKFKNKFFRPTISACRGINDLFNLSLVQKSWTDFYFKIEDNVCTYATPSGKFEVSFHDPYEVNNYREDFRFLPKLMSPFYIKAPKDLKILQHKAMYHLKSDRNFMSGVTRGSIRPNIIFSLSSGEDFISYEEELMYYTPLTEKKIKIHYELITEQQFHEKIKINTALTFGHNRALKENRWL